jgi:peptidoglycan-associated lipoprotein
MKKYYPVVALFCAFSCLFLTTGCKKKKSGVWDETKTAGSLKNSDPGSFWGEGDNLAFGPEDEDFVPLKDDDLKAQFADGAIPQSKHVPGEEGSGIPGISHFKNPTSTLASVFRSLYFNTDDHILRGKESLALVDNMASYLKGHPDTYIFVEGHCDERGPEAYNLSLGARRANYVRSLLVKKGVDLNQIHTISYGKEKPADLRHDSEGWSKNRRAQFKIYEK